MKQEKIKGVKARAYVGVWNHGVLGWAVPQFIYKARTPQIFNSSHNNDFAVGSWAYLCEVTIKPIKVKGKYKRRKIK